MTSLLFHEGRILYPTIDRVGHEPGRLVPWVTGKRMQNQIARKLNVANYYTRCFSVDLIDRIACSQRTTSFHFWERLCRSAFCFHLRPIGACCSRSRPAAIRLADLMRPRPSSFGRALCGARWLQSISSGYLGVPIHSGHSPTRILNCGLSARRITRRQSFALVQRRTTPLVRHDLTASLHSQLSENE